MSQAPSPQTIPVRLTAGAWGAIAGIIAAYGDSYKDGAMIVAAEEISAQVEAALTADD